DDLLRIARLNTWPLKIKLVLGKFHSYDDYVFLKFASLYLEFMNHARYTYIGDEPIVSSDTEFVIRKRNIFVLVVEIAVEIFACGSENIRLGETPKDQTLWAIRVISTYVTFYKAIIPASYWIELANGLPKKNKKLRLK
ncbi:7288_t:CDS:2, partial [Funneliformis caledonium]